ncbi:hypothetical protein CLIB1444_02S00232 [[Candida] jaroonii]|uniref:Uncharacterized protein n=1 Tax=[Candida] jaroonii TaxID=467808 RepID=A0ACA9Y363_9ASCO|nr:hypothetical protein CLIB1444_02S00232 [[Candida] jaroonii]
MIGRLFRQNSSSSLNLDTSQQLPIQQQLQQSGQNSYEDGYTREILYGVNDKSILKPFELNNKFFRIVVSQDGGNLRTKQVLFDSSMNETKSNKINNNTKSNLSRNILTSKIHHNINELHDYMFGCGLPTIEHQSVTKIHILPIVNNQTYGSYKSILITRLFSLTDSQDSNDQPISDWVLKPTLPINETKINTNSKNISSRFGIGLVIPLPDDESDIISNNWNVICHYLIVLQKIVGKKLINILSENVQEGTNQNNYIINRRIQFPSYTLSGDNDLFNQLIKLIKLTNYNSNIPKLINSNSLIKTSSQIPKFHPILINWVVEVLNWLEFKELNQSSKFLSSLFALIIPLRFQLSENPIHYDYDSTSNSKDIVRIVIMTGNPMVAKKLAFIINGLIPDSKVFNLLSDDNLSLDMNELDIDTDIDDDDDNLSTHSRLDAEIDLALDDENNDAISEDYNYKPPVINSKPIPIKGRSSFSSLDNSFSNPSFKGWDIGKSTTSTSINSTSKNLPITKSSLSKSSSMAYLSSSLNSSLSSSTSNYSLTKLGGSFIDKWKNSFNSSMNTNYDNIDYLPPNKSNNVNRKLSVQTLRTPSPAIEIEEFNLPKTQSMVDLNNNLKKSIKIDDDLISRTKNSVYKDGTFISNDNKIKNKISTIMNQEYFNIEDDELSIDIEPINQLPNELCNYENLLPNVAFTDEFRSEFILQSCPINPRLEQQVINSMKNDLLFYQNNCKINNISSRTIFISLRAREIKLIEMKSGETISPTNIDSPSPIQSYFSDFKRNGSYKTSIKKVYTPTKNHGDRELINIIDKNLNQMNDLFYQNLKETNNEYNNEFYEKLSRLVFKLIN